MGTRIYLYPVWIRLWHIVNALCFILLIVTGLSLQYTSADSEFILIRFDHAVSIHNISAIILTIGYISYVIGNVITPNHKHYIIRRKNYLRNLIKQFRFYAFGMFKKEEHPFPVSEDDKFNPLQKISYVLAMFIGMPVLILSGLGLLFPDVLAKQVFGISGLLINDIIHITIGFILSVFMIIHIYTCTLGDKPGTLFKSMMNGYHEEH